MPKTQSSWSSVVGFDIRATMFESCFEFTQNIREANIILHTGFFADESKKWLLEHQFILSDKLLIDVSACYHIQEYQSEQYLLDRLFKNSKQPLSEIPENRRPKFILLHTCHNILDDMHPQIWYTDFLWNRQINFFVTKHETEYSELGKNAKLFYNKNFKSDLRKQEILKLIYEE